MNQGKVVDMERRGKTILTRLRVMKGYHSDVLTVQDGKLHCDIHIGVPEHEGLADLNFIWIDLFIFRNRVDSLPILTCVDDRSRERCRGFVKCFLSLLRCDASSICNGRSIDDIVEICVIFSMRAC